MNNKIEYNWLAVAIGTILTTIIIYAIISKLI